VRIVAARWRGRALVAPRGEATRPTADRARQALFDRLLHAPWGGRAVLEGVCVLDAFAGTGALGLEALSRGAGQAVFIEPDRAALAALRANIAACRAEAETTVIAGDATRPPAGRACGLVFLDPPYRQGLVARALGALRSGGWLAPGALLVIETAADEPEPVPDLGGLLASAVHGAARIGIFRS
jgi:16S rRNA (guanine966-N2)-methyltransferase